MAIKILSMTQDGTTGQHYPLFTDDLLTLPDPAVRQLRAWLYSDGDTLTLALLATSSGATLETPGYPARTLTFRRGPYRVTVKDAHRTYYFQAAFTEDHRVEVLGPLMRVTESREEYKQNGLDHDFRPEWPVWLRAYPDTFYGHEKQPAVPARVPAGPSKAPRTVDDEYLDLGPETIGKFESWGTTATGRSAQTIEVLRETQLSRCRIVTSKVLFSQLDETMRLLALAAGATALAEQSDSKQYPYQTLVFNLENAPLVQHFRRYKEFDAALQGHEQVVSQLRGEYDDR